MRSKKLVTVIHCPRQYKIRLWFPNRQQDFKTDTYSQIVFRNLDAKLREDVKRREKIRADGGLRHKLGIKVRGRLPVQLGV